MVQNVTDRGMAAQAAVTGPVFQRPGATHGRAAGQGARGPIRPVWSNFARSREQITYHLRRFERFELRPLIMRSD